MEPKGIRKAEKFPCHKCKETDHFPRFCRNNVKYQHKDYSNDQEEIFKIRSINGNQNISY